MKFEHFQQVLEMKDERTEETPVLVVVCLVLVGNTTKSKKGHNVHQLPQDSLSSPQAVPLKTCTFKGNPLV